MSRLPNHPATLGGRPIKPATTTPLHLLPPEITLSQVSLAMVVVCSKLQMGMVQANFRRGPIHKDPCCHMMALGWRQPILNHMHREPFSIAGSNAATSVKDSEEALTKRLVEDRSLPVIRISHVRVKAATMSSTSKADSSNR